MKKLFYAFCLLFISSTAFAQNAAIKVTVQQNADGSWTLMREGKPYYVRGVGGQTEMDKAVEIGANSIRTWSADNAQEVLDEAYSKGLTVMLGLWLQHERHGFDYSNAEKVETQLEYFRSVVMQYKDHPALLMWGVGNEVDLQYTNTNVWYAVNDIAAMIHELDPNHPTITVTAGLDADEVRLIKERAPQIDIYGINTYGDIGNVKRNIKQFGWNGPYMITEWGPNGHWEVAKTKWNVPVEQSSKEKAASYKSRYLESIQGDAAQCLGSYVFLWGFKQETTSTWYGLFSEKGEVSQAVNELERIWLGREPANAAPMLDSAFLESQVKGRNILIASGSRAHAIVYVSDPNNDKISYHWELVPESNDIRSGGDAEAKPQPLRNIGGRKSKNQFSFIAPEEEGAYRLFIYAYDGHKNYAYINIPFYVTMRADSTEPTRAIQFKKQNLTSYENK